MEVFSFSPIFNFVSSKVMFVSPKSRCPIRINRTEPPSDSVKTAIRGIPPDPKGVDVGMIVGVDSAVDTDSAVDAGIFVFVAAIVGVETRLLLEQPPTNIRVSVIKINLRNIILSHVRI